MAHSFLKEYDNYSFKEPNSDKCQLKNLSNLLPLDKIKIAITDSAPLGEPDNL